MSLITIQRSPTTSDVNSDLNIDSTSVDNIDNYEENIIQSEDYFASNDIIVLQNRSGRRRSSVINEGDTMQFNFIKTNALLRKEDSLKLMVSLEKVNSKLEGQRYFGIIATNGNQGTEEFLILGLDISFNKTTIGFVLPICRDMSVIPDGDCGFKISNKDGEKLFKPSSVHALWTTVQMLNKACSTAHQLNYYIGGLSHTWVGFYQISSNRAQIAEWNRMIAADTVTNSSLAPKSAIGELVFGTDVNEDVKNKDDIRRHLKEIMREENLDVVTGLFLRERLQGVVSFNLKEYKSFIAEEILIIYGLMDSASQILPYLYLGSTYNSSNLDELLKNKVSHILNVTKESENFFRERFIYRNVEVFDVDETNLLNYFTGCYQFINEAKSQNSACLVHCQRGISRSATVVIAYMMKEFNLSRDDALKEVKCKRECILPNDGFMTQLKTYEGILKASGQRHNRQFQTDKRGERVSFPNELYQIQEDDNVTDYPSNSNMTTNHRPASFSSHTPSSKAASAQSYTDDEDNNNNFFGVNDTAAQSQTNETAKPQLRLKGDASWIRPHSVVSVVEHTSAQRETDSDNNDMVHCSRQCHSAELVPGPPMTPDNVQ